MTWLTAIVRAVLDWLTAEAKQPRTLTDANTPDPLLRRWRDSLRDRLRDKDRRD